MVCITFGGGGARDGKRREADCHVCYSEQGYNKARRDSDGPLFHFKLNIITT